MYSTCLFCNAAFGANESIERFPVGGRLAFDAAKGRLWAICAACGRWNLSPIEDRWEAIEECERQFRATFVRVSTGNIGLARLSSGVELIRVGKPLRPEFAAWRYAGQLRLRRRRSRAVAAVGIASAAVTGLVLVPVATALLTAGSAVAAFLLPGISMAFGSLPVLGALVARDYVEEERVVARFAQGRRVLNVRAKHLESIELHANRDVAETSIVIHHDRGWKTFTGTEAIHATGVVLAGTNRFGADASDVASAVRLIENAGDAQGFLATASDRNGWRRAGRLTSVLNHYRGLGAMKLAPAERLALEMAVHEESERRVMDGELAVLESAWRDAEEIARIVDDELTVYPN